MMMMSFFMMIMMLINLQALTPLNDALNRKEMDNAMVSAGVASVACHFQHFFTNDEAKNSEI